eukprot:2518179-Rhodomonas_salina.1
MGGEECCWPCVALMDGNGGCCEQRFALMHANVRVLQATSGLDQVWAGAEKRDSSISGNARATGCPVLTSSMLLLGGYAPRVRNSTSVEGFGWRPGSTLCSHYTKSGTELRCPMSGTQLAVLKKGTAYAFGKVCCAACGTEKWYAGERRCICLGEGLYGATSRGLAAYEHAMQSPVLTYAHYAISLRTRYAMSGTDLANQNSSGRMRRVFEQRIGSLTVKSAICLRACYAMPGTKMSYRRTRLLRDVQY